MKSTILVVDDSELVQLIISEVLKDKYKLFQYTQPLDALKDSYKRTYHCVILDLMMPDLTGHDFLVKFREFDQNTPVIILTAKECNEVEIAQLFELGANDFITKPFLNLELIARINNHIKLRQTTNKLLKVIKREERLNEKIIEKTLKLKKMIKRIRLLNKKLKYYATHDKLTGFLNRRAFFSFLENDIKRVKRKNSNLTLLMLDLDFFKNINDKFGHLVGDFILEEFSNILSTHLRDIDLICRYGGEEFLVLLTDTSLENGYKVAEKLREMVEKKDFIIENRVIKITVSIGLALYTMNEDIDHFVQRADEACYKAKNGGRNRVEIYS